MTSGSCSGEISAHVALISVQWAVLSLVRLIQTSVSAWNKNTILAVSKYLLNVKYVPSTVVGPGTGRGGRYKEN